MTIWEGGSYKRRESVLVCTGSRSPNLCSLYTQKKITVAMGELTMLRTVGKQWGEVPQELDGVEIQGPHPNSESKF